MFLLYAGVHPSTSEGVASTLVFNESYVVIFSFLRNCQEGIPRTVEDLFLRGNVGETVYDPVPPVPEELSVGFLEINLVSKV